MSQIALQSLLIKNKGVRLKDIVTEAQNEYMLQTLSQN